MKRINGIEVTATEFFYDGCHKIYLVNDESDKAQFFDNGWDGNDLFPIDMLPEIWADTCPLRFVYSADLKVEYVSQCEPAKFEGWHIEPETRRILADIRREQMEANGY